MFEQHQEFSRLLHRAAALWRSRLDERLRPWQMTQATWRVLWLLRLADVRYNQRSLAQRLGIETPTLVPILDRLEKLGLLRREPDSRDRRQKYLAITDAGLALTKQIEGEVVAVRAEMLRGVYEAELVAASGLLARIIDNAAGPAG